MAGASLQGLMTRSGQRVTEMAKSGQASGFFKRHVEQTLPGLARQVMIVRVTKFCSPSWTVDF